MNPIAQLSKRRSYSVGGSPPIRSPPISSPAISAEGGVSSWIAVARNQQSQQSLSFRFLADVQRYSTGSVSLLDSLSPRNSRRNMKKENSRARVGEDRSILSGNKIQYRGAKRKSSCFQPFLPCIPSIRGGEGGDFFFFTPAIIHFPQPRYNAT